MNKLYLSSVLSAVILLAFSNTSSAQLHVYTGAGANVSMIDIKSVVVFNSDYVTNYFISARPEYRLSNFLSFSCDVQYSVKGTNLVSTDPDLSRKAKLGFVDIIPQVGLKFLPFLEIYGGVGVGLNTSELVKFGNKGYIKPIVNIYNNDFSLVTGARVKISRFVFHGHFSNSLRNLNDLNLTDSMGNVIKYEEILRNIQIGIAYQLL